MFSTKWYVLLRNYKKKSHCVKSVQIRSFFCSVFSKIWTEYGKIRTRKNSVLGHFSRNEYLIEIFWIFTLLDKLENKRNSTQEQKKVPIVILHYKLFFERIAGTLAVTYMQLWRLICYDFAVVIVYTIELLSNRLQTYYLRQVKSFIFWHKINVKHKMYVTVC